MKACASDHWRHAVVYDILPLALDGVDLGDDVIEIGPGPGFTTDVLMQRTTRLTAIEIDQGLAGSLAERLAGTNVTVFLGDATALDLPADRFTGAACFHMLHHVGSAAEQDRAMAELARVLRPGGVFVAADAVYDEGTAAFHADDTYNPIPMEDVVSRLEAVGFTDVAVRPYAYGWLCTARAR